MSWDNAALISLNTMKDLGIEENEAIELELNGRKVIAPVLAVPGHPDGVVTVHLGFGRSVENGSSRVPVSASTAYLLRTSSAPLMDSGLKVTRGKGTYDLCVTKTHSIEHRGAYAQHDLQHPEIGQAGNVFAARSRSAGARHHPLRERRRGPQGAPTSRTKARRIRSAP